MGFLGRFFSVEASVAGAVSSMNRRQLRQEIANLKAELKVRFDIMNLTSASKPAGQ